jgi:hypothetical protein
MAPQAVLVRFALSTAASIALLVGVATLPSSHVAIAAPGKPVSRATPSPIPNFPLTVSGSLPAPHSHTHSGGVTSYRCPMDCEHGKLYPLATDCPVCHMKMVEFKNGRVEHSDHTSKHGGVFFMDADNWHHVEGVLENPREFRLYLYDNFTTAVYAGQYSGTLDLTSGVGQKGIVMTTGPNGAYLQAALPESSARPICLAVHVVLNFGKPTSLFNFTFDSK